MDWVINILSDTGGYATEQIVKQSLLQFDIDYSINIFPNIRNIEKCKQVLNNLKFYGQNQILYRSFQDPKLNIYIENYAIVNNIECVDVLSYSIKTISNVTKLKAKSLFSQDSLYDTNIFKRLDAIDFAMKNDDGKDFDSIKYADIAIIGISRTSKTPLSMYLAMKGLRVVNIPILREMEIPRQLYEIDSSKIIGLTIDKNILKDIRRQRLRLLGLNENSQYSDIKIIEKELEYAKEIMDDIECFVIDTTNKALEEISEIILNYLKSIERR